MLAGDGVAPRQQFTERTVPHHRAVSRERLPENLFAVGDEKQRRPPTHTLGKLPVVERGDNRLARAGRGDHQVAVPVVNLAFHRKRVEHAFLMRVGRHVEVGEADRRALAKRAAIVLVKGLLQVITIQIRVVPLEVFRLPVA